MCVRFRLLVCVFAGSGLVHPSFFSLFHVFRVKISLVFVRRCSRALLTKRVPPTKWALHLSCSMCLFFCRLLYTMESFIRQKNQLFQPQILLSCVPYSLYSKKALTSISCSIRLFMQSVADDGIANSSRPWKKTAMLASSYASLCGPQTTTPGCIGGRIPPRRKQHGRRVAC